jgi:dihydroorotase
MNHWELNNNIKSYKNQKLKEKPNLLKNEINNMTKSKDSSKSNDIQGLDISDISKPSSTMSTIPLNINNINKKHVHICHVSTSEGVSLLRGFLKSNSYEPVVLTSEVTPHHLLLNERFDGKAFGKVNPPLRSVEDQAALWSALADGIINIIASDHAPHTLEEKNYEFSLAPAGIPGVETMLPLMLSHVKHNRLPLERVINAITSTPAALFQLPKGRLAKGYDGDLIVIDFYKENDIKVKNLHSKCEWTPYENMAAIFPLLTVVRGNIIVKDGNLEADPGFGKFFN